MTIFLLSLPFWYSFIKATFMEVLSCCVAGQLVQNFSNHVENLVYLSWSEHFSVMARLIWSVACILTVYTTAYFLLASRLKQKNHTAHPRFIIGFSVIVNLFVFAMQYLFQLYQIDGLWITRPPLMLCCVFALCVQFGFFELGQERENNLLLEQMIDKEHHQMELTQEAMDAINRKAHDLKHQIARLRTMALSDASELAEIEEAVAQYELSFHTGNPTLDAILSEKQLICNQHQIALSVMAQGEALSFLRPGEIASLFGNALDNAIECEKGIEAVTRRCIAVQLFENKGLLCLRVENFCPEEADLSHGLPLTTKPDRLDHGFGLRSIQYIAGQHGGSMTISCENRLFILNVLMQRG